VNAYPFPRAKSLGTQGPKTLGTGTARFLILPNIFHNVLIFNDYLLERSIQNGPAQTFPDAKTSP
jgi:hypothetical protein